MSRTLARVAVILASLAYAMGAAAAQSGLFDAINPPLRSAWSYLRAENPDLALVELDALQAAASAIPDLPAEAGRLIADASGLAGTGELKAAGEKLHALRQLLRELNQQAGETRFEDCIWDANRLGDEVWGFIRNSPDFAAPGVQDAVVAALAAYKGELKACDTAAPAEVSKDQEYRRLMVGTLPSLDIAIKAARAKDGNTLHRYLIEIISFDRLLYFRFG